MQVDRQFYPRAASISAKFCAAGSRPNSPACVSNTCPSDPSSISYGPRAAVHGVLSIRGRTASSTPHFLASLQSRTLQSGP